MGEGAEPAQGAGGGLPYQYTCHHMCELGALSNRTWEKGAYATEVQASFLQRCLCVSGGEGRGGRPCGLESPCLPVQAIWSLQELAFPSSGLFTRVGLSVATKRCVCVHRRMSSWGSVCVGCLLSWSLLGLEQPGVLPTLQPHSNFSIPSPSTLALWPRERPEQAYGEMGSGA